MSILNLKAITAYFLFKNRAKVVFLTALLVSVFFVSSVSAQVGDPLGMKFGSETNLGNQDVRVTVASLISTMLSMLGMIALVIIIFGGFKWMVSGGDDEKVHEARQIIISGIIGIAIILSSYAITSFLIREFAAATNYHNPII